MQHRKLAYHNGHFYDTGSGRRILPKSGAEFMLIANHTDDLPDAPPAGEYKETVRTNSQLAGLAVNKGQKIVRLLEAGETLTFVVTAPQEPHISHLFTIELREDLFLCADLGNDPAGEKPKDYGTLFPCRCVVWAQPDQVPFPEPVYAESVNSAITRALVHYFGNEGSKQRSAMNVCETRYGDKLRDLREQYSGKLWKLKEPNTLF